MFADPDGTTRILSTAAHQDCCEHWRAEARGYGRGESKLDNEINPALYGLPNGNAIVLDGIRPITLILLQVGIIVMGFRIGWNSEQSRSVWGGRNQVSKKDS